MTDLSNVEGLYVSFTAHHNFKDAHTLLNNQYAGFLPDLDHLFTDDQKTALKDDVVDLILHDIAHELILPEASETTDVADIVRIINSAATKVSSNGRQSSRLTKARLEALITALVASDKPGTIEIKIPLTHVYFKTEKVAYLDWSTFSTNRADAYTPPGETAGTASAPGTPGLADLVTALANAPNAESIATAVTNAIQRQPTPTRPTPAYVFDDRTLPVDVKQRYIRFKEKKVILGQTVNTPYDNGLRYYLDGTERLFLADGSLFVIQNDFSEKGLLRDPVVCKDDSHQGLRAWYVTLTRHANDHGFYVHPFYCFRTDHGGDWGFSAGDDAEDDLPQRLEIPLQQMTQPLFRLLQKPEMFPKDSKCIQIIQQCYGDGYSALKQIIFRSHPVFHEQPATLLTSYPQQLNSPLLKYHALFMDHLQLRAFVFNIDSSLDDKHELDIFINRTRFNEFLNRVTREERTQASLRYKYSSSQICETLEKFLNAPDSPLRKEQRGPLKSSASSQRVSNRNDRQGARRPTPVHVAQITDNDQATNGVPALSMTLSDDSIVPLQEELRYMDYPPGDESMRLATLYDAAIYKLRTTPNLNEPLPCVVCDGNHRFDKCEVLQNTDFLKAHYIRFCQQLRREMQSRSRAFGSSLLPPTESRSVHFTDVETADAPADADAASAAEEDDECEDFRRGRR